MLPPQVAAHYKRRNPLYQPPPPLASICRMGENEVKPLSIVYPYENSQIHLPRTAEGKEGYAIFEAAHYRDSSVIYWHLDAMYLGSTQHFHKMKVKTQPGKHVLTLEDEWGNMVKKSFVVVGNF
jgi:penicillin-binding protein 1C